MATETKYSRAQLQEQVDGLARKLNAARGELLSMKGNQTTEQLRTRILELIGQWLQNPKVQASEPAVLVLNALAGDIQVIDLG